MIIDAEHDMALMLTVYIPVSETANDTAEQIKEEISANVVSDYLGFEGGCEEDNRIILSFGCDKVGGCACGISDFDVEDIAKKLGTLFPDCIFEWYAEDTEDGHSNSRAVIKGSDVREDYSIMVDSMLSLEPENTMTAQILCELTPTELKKLKEALNGLHIKYEAKEMSKDSFRLLATCPECSRADWRYEDETFHCVNCGAASEPEGMSLTSEDEIEGGK